MKESQKELGEHVMETKRGVVADGRFSLEDILNHFGVDYQEVVDQNAGKGYYSVESVIAAATAKRDKEFAEKLEHITSKLDADKALISQLLEQVINSVDVIHARDFNKRVIALNKVCKTLKEKWIFGLLLTLLGMMVFMRIGYPVIYQVRNGLIKPIADLGNQISETRDAAQGNSAQILGDGGNTASPLKAKTLQDLIDYQPSYGQSFGPETGNSRSYGPHGGVDFDCRVGGCAGEEVTATITGKISEIRRIGSSSNGASYQIHIVGSDWAGEVEHQLVHVDNIKVRVGDSVNAGQVVALVSPTDSLSTGAHLDWKIKRNGQWVNPQKWAADALEKGKQ